MLMACFQTLNYLYNLLQNKLNYTIIFIKLDNLLNTVVKNHHAKTMQFRLTSHSQSNNCLICEILNN